MNSSPSLVERSTAYILHDVTNRRKYTVSTHSFLFFFNFSFVSLFFFFVHPDNCRVSRIFYLSKRQTERYQRTEHRSRPFSSRRGRTRGRHERGTDTFYFPATVSPTQLKTSQQADVLFGCPLAGGRRTDSRTLAATTCSFVPFP